MNTQLVDKLEIHIPKHLFGTQNWLVWSAAMSHTLQSMTNNIAS